MSRLFENLLNEDVANVQEPVDAIKAKYDPYTVLGLKHDADLSAIKSAYRKLSKEYHPDLHPGDEEAAMKFKELSQAYKFLADANWKKQYDELYAQQQQQQQTKKDASKQQQQQQQQTKKDANKSSQNKDASKQQQQQTIQLRGIFFKDWLAKNYKITYDSFIRSIRGLEATASNTFVFPLENKHVTMVMLDKVKKEVHFVNETINKAPTNRRASAFSKGETMQNAADESTVLASIQKFLGSRVDKPVLDAVNLSNTYVNDPLKNSAGMLIHSIPLNFLNAENLYDGKNVQLFRDYKGTAYCAAISDQERQRYINDATTNFQRTIAKHPYASQVLQAGEDELTGKKYNSVGKSSWVRDSIRNFRLSAKRILESKQLNEDWAKIDGEKIIDDIYGTPENLKWDEKNFVDCVNAARNGDQTAIGYIMYTMAPIIVRSFWKNYVGPNGKLGQIKINKDGGLKKSFISWIGTALQALIKGGVATKRKDGSDRVKASTLDGFDENKVTGDPLHAFCALFKLDLQTQAIHLNKEKTRKGIAGLNDGDEDAISYVNVDDDADERAAANDDDSVYAQNGFEDGVLDKISDDAFMEKWKDYCQDDRLNKGSCSMAKCLKILIEHPNETNMRNLADIAGCSRNGFAFKCQDAAKLLQQYDLSYNDLAKAIRSYGKDKVASYLFAA